MKKLMLVAIALFTLNATAQKGKKEGHRKEMAKIHQNMSAEEQAEIKTKEMTLALDLSGEQQKQVYEVFLEQAKDRKANVNKRKEVRKKWSEQTKDEYVKMRNERLDAQIEMQKKMKSILTEEQYKKFEATHESKRAKGQLKSGRKK